MVWLQTTVWTEYWMQMSANPFVFQYIPCFQLLLCLGVIAYTLLKISLCVSNLPVSTDTKFWSSTIQGIHPLPTKVPYRMADMSLPSPMSQQYDIMYEKQLNMESFLKHRRNPEWHFLYNISSSSLVAVCNRSIFYTLPLNNRSWGDVVKYLHRNRR